MKIQNNQTSQLENFNICFEYDKTYAQLKNETRARSIK